MNNQFLLQSFIKFLFLFVGPNTISFKLQSYNDSYEKTYFQTILKDACSQEQPLYFFVEQKEKVF